ncbi:nascent polypeptide-associated complex subunit alpha, partial [Monosporozyma servazzii]
MSAIPANANVTILSKNEKKAREIITKLGLTKVKGIVRVAFRKRNNEIIAIEQPDVYKTIGGNYVVFGEPKKDDFTQRLAAAQEGLQQTEISGEGDVDKSPEAIQADMQAAADAIEGSAAPAATEGDDEDEDAGDLSNDDIELVMQQANVTRGKAIKALKLHDADIVNAIMSLSK